MATKKPSHPFKVGDRVKLRYWPELRHRVVEERGPLGPGGMLVYRIRIAGKWKRPFVEVCEDQPIAIPPAPEGKAMPPARRRAGGELKGE